MKLASFGSRVDEKPFLEEWAQRTGNEIMIFTETLNEETVVQAEGAVGITCLQTVPYSAELFAKMAAMGINYLAIRNVGLDNVDLVGAAAAGVRVSNVPAYSPSAIAEFAVTLTMSLARNLGRVQERLRADDYLGSGVFMGREIGHSTVGVIGTGRIGREAIRIFKGFGAHVLAFDPFPPAESDIEYVDMETLLKQSDIVDLHVPGLPQNTHMIGADQIAIMKDDAILINTARPNLVDTAALLEALRSGHIAGAGIDTFEYEEQDLLNLEKNGRFNDPVWDEMLAMPNVILTPHIAYYTATAVRNMVEFSIDNLTSFLETGAAKDEVHAR